MPVMGGCFISNHRGKDRGAIDPVGMATGTLGILVGQSKGLAAVGNRLRGGKHKYAKVMDIAERSGEHRAQADKSQLHGDGVIL